MPTWYPRFMTANYTVLCYLTVWHCHCIGPVPVSWAQFKKEMGCSWFAARGCGHTVWGIVTSSKAEVMRFVCHSVCVQDYCKSNQRFHWTWCHDWAYQSQELVRPCSGSRYGSQITFPRRGSLGGLLAFLIQSPADFHDTRWSDWRRHDNESTTFWERSGRHPDPNPDSNPRSLLVEVRHLVGGLHSLEGE